MTNMKGKSIYKIVALFLVVIGMNACYFDVIVEDDLSEDQEISFQNDLVPIFQSTCISCHDGAITSPNLYPSQAYHALVDENYVIAGDADNSALVKKLNDEHPYQGAITATELQAIKMWINQGAAQN